uniref:Juvenile hormone diol kinase n=1 Tax=Plutella xylostella TaxID=51655 RepID=Q6F457_PLUXY|nr:Juvenile hormone diol kinase [Plutella xylostella]
MVSDFRKKKLQHVFNVFFDVDRSGSVDKKDFEAAVVKAAAVRGWKAGDASYKDAEAVLNKIWAGLSSADANNDGQVNFDEWVAVWEKSSDADWQNAYAKFIFDLEDASADGAIDGDEFSTVYAAYGLSVDESKAAFQKMSKGKANVSWAEFQALWKEYFTSEDVNAAGNSIFGKSSF